MKRMILAAFAALSPLFAHAVFVNPDGTGQALIYPYYTVQSANGDTFNTYVSLVNHASAAKAVRVRLRESRGGKEVGALNLYLAGHDTWTGALVPDGSGGAKLVSSDLSCNSVLNGQGWALPLSGAQYSGPNDDGIAGGPDRLREGWIEVLEMGEIGVPGAVTALTHNAAGYPANCDAVEPAIVAGGAGAVGPPGGALSGTLTLINVANGVNFAVKAEALDQLATRAFYRKASDPYPDFAAQEIDPVSVTTTGRTTWVSYWINPFDAVSAALLRQEAWGEYVLDKATASHTEVVLTFPTRQYYRTINSGYQDPVRGTTGWFANCTPGTGAPVGTQLGIGYSDREGNTYVPLTSDNNLLSMPQDGTVCASSAVLEVGTAPSTAPTGLLGSSRGFYTRDKIGQAEDGWIAITPYATNITMQSLNRSVRIDAPTGTVTTGPHVLFGMPMTGFVVRTFTNGALHCSAGTCLGNYGGAYPLDYRRMIQPAS
jgi:hypothetical protein